MALSNKAYDTLKWIAQYFLPAVGSLYLGLSKIWGFPNGEEVMGTIAVLDTFLGIMLGISSANYNKQGA